MSSGIRDILDRCESDLRDLGAEALRAGRYAEARRAMEVAEAVAALDGGGQSERPDGAATSGVAASGSHKRGAGQVTRGAATTGKSTGSSKKKGKGRQGREGYPRYKRRGETLVRVGWSKKSRREYEHKASWQAVHAMVEHLRNTVRADALWSVDDVTPVPDPVNGGDLPGYQIYLILGWLREAGVVEKQGRDRYALAGDGVEDGAVQRCWSALPAA